MGRGCSSGLPRATVGRLVQEEAWGGCSELSLKRPRNQTVCLEESTPESRLGALVTSRYSSCRALAGGPGARAKARSPEKASDPQGAERGSAGEGSCGGAGCSEEKPKADAGKSRLGRAGPRCESKEGLVCASLSGHKAEGPAGVGYGGLGDWASFSGCSRAPFSSSESLGLSSQGPRPGSLGEGVLRSGLQLRM